MINPQPLTRTKSRSLNGNDTVTGGSIIMPRDISDAETYPGFPYYNGPESPNKRCSATTAK